MLWPLFVGKVHFLIVDLKSFFILVKNIKPNPNVEHLK